MNPRIALLAVLLLGALLVRAQQDSLPGNGSGGGGGRGDGSGGGRGDGSGGGRWQQAIVPVIDTAAAKRPAVRMQKGHTSRPRRQYFAGVSLDPWKEGDPSDAESGSPLPERMVLAIAQASSPSRKLALAGALVDSALASATAADQYAWGDTLLTYAMMASDTAGLVKAHFARGSALIRGGRNGRAFEDLRTAHMLAEAQHDLVMQVMIDARIGDGIMSMGGSTGARQRYEEALRIAAVCDVPPATLAHLLASMAYIHADVDLVDSAETYFLRAIEVSRKAGLKGMEAQCLIRLGNMEAAHDSLSAALGHFRAAIAISEAGNEARSLLDARMALGTVLLHAERLPEARSEFRAAVRLADSLDVPFVRGQARLLLSEAMDDDDHAAMVLLRETDDIARAQGSGSLRKEVMLSYAERYARTGRSKEAFDLAMDAVRLTDSLNSAFWEVGAQRQLRRSQVGLKDRDIADLERQRETQSRAAAEQEERIVFQRKLIAASIAVGLLVFTLGFAAYRAYRAKLRSSAELAIAHIEVLRQKERAQSSERAKDRFLANVSHEIRTPLNAIIGFTDLLLYERHDAQTLRYLGSVRDAGANLLVLINDVLDLSRMEAGRLTLQREPFDLHRTVRASAEMLEHRAREQHDELRVDIASGVPRWVLGDAHRLTQMLLNLMGNALKFTTHGSVEVVVDLYEDRVRVKVIDSGIGIAPDKLKSVFERFTQVHTNDQHLYGGTGLGLSIVKELVTLHQGHVEVESDPGRGTTFTLLLPYEHTTAPTAVSAGATAMNGAADRVDGMVLQDRVILIAEDNPLNAQVTTATLMRHYPHVVTVVVSNGREAVDRVVADIDGDIALVLMDVQMPVLDGLAATRELRAHAAEQGRIPIIALTASVSPGDLSQCIEAGMDACVPKPFRAQELVDAIARLTGDGGVELAHTVPGPEDVDDLALFRELVPERLQRLRMARSQGDHAEMKRLVHFMKFQLVRYDQERFAAPIERLLLAAPGSGFDREVDELINNLDDELA